MEEHRHVPGFGGSGKCYCGVYVCDALSPNGKIRCRLNKGHSGPHTNTWNPEYGMWDDEGWKNK